MALGDAYAQVADLKERMDIGDTIDDDRLAAALISASGEINQWCGRQFNDAGSASARVFRPVSSTLVVTEDFHTTTGLTVVVDSGVTGTYDETWTSTDYLLEPANGVVAGVPGWPYNRLVGVTYTFPRTTRPVVQVTARWGWAAVPAQVEEACLLIAAESFKLADAPFGAGGVGEFGPVRVRITPRAQGLLIPYRRKPSLVA